MPKHEVQMKRRLFFDDSTAVKWGERVSVCVWEEIGVKVVLYIDKHNGLPNIANHI